MKKVYFTRKNLIELTSVFSFYSFYLSSHVLMQGTYSLRKITQLKYSILLLAYQV